MELFFFVLPLVLVAAGYILPDFAGRPRRVEEVVRPVTCRRR